MPVTEMSTQIQRAAQLLRAGELVAFPTETVYGLGADASNPVAVAKIFAAKGRPADHPLIVHLASAAHLERWARDIPVAARKLAAAFWPGPLTLILKRQPTVPDAVTGGQDTVGLRVPNHPLALELLREFGGADGGGLAAPSANRYGRISPTLAQHVAEELGDRIAMILDGGPCAVGIESTILDLSGDPCVTPRILRPGMISAEAIAAVLGQQPEQGTAPNSPNAPNTPRVSGSLAAHYAPRTPMQLVATSELALVVTAELNRGTKLAVMARQPSSDAREQLHWRVASADFSQYSHDLYANLRSLDAAGCDLILVEAPPVSAEWCAVADRLGRAVTGSGKD